MKYAHYDETNGKLLGWYDSEIHGIYVPGIPEVLNDDGTIKTEAIPAYTDLSNIPTPNIEVSDEDWQISIDNNYNYVDVVTNTLSFKDFRTFTQLQESKISQLRQSRDEANTIPVSVSVTDITTSTTTDYNFVAGYESSQMLNGKRNLVKESFALGLITDDNVGFVTDNDINVLLSMADATTVVISVASAYEDNFRKYKDLKSQVATATTQSELDAMVW